MSAQAMEITGMLLLAGGVIFFILTQTLLGRWQQSYEAEIRRL